MYLKILTVLVCVFWVGNLVAQKPGLRAGQMLDSHFTRVTSQNDVLLKPNSSFTIRLGGSDSIVLHANFSKAIDRPPFDYSVTSYTAGFYGTVVRRDTVFLWSEDSTPYAHEPIALEKGQLLNHHKSFFFEERYSQNVQWTTFSRRVSDPSGDDDTWLGLYNKYLGFRFGDSTGYKYGWLEISNPSIIEMRLHSYGYQSNETIDTVINLKAVSTLSATADSKVSKPYVVGNQLYFSDHKSEENIPLSIYNVNGQLLLQQVYRGSPITLVDYHGLIIVQYQSEHGPCVVRFFLQ